MSRAIRFVQNVSSNYLVTGVDAAVFIFLTPVIVRHLGVDGFAVWVMVQTVAYYLDFLDFGLADAQVRQHAALVSRSDKSALRNLQGTVFLLYLLAGVAALAIAIGLTALPLENWLEIPESAQPSFAPLLLLFGVATLLGFLEGGLDNVFEGYQRFDAMNVVHIVFQLLSAAATVIALKLGFGLIALALIMCADAAFGALTKLVIIHRMFPPEAQPGFRFDKTSWLSIRSYSLWNSLNDFVTEGTSQLDRLLIPILLSTALLTPYSLVVSLAAAIFLLAEPISDTFLPIAAERHDQRDRQGMAVFVKRGTKLVTLATLPVTVVIAVFGATILDLWIGSEYTAIPAAVIWFTAANFFFSTYLWTSLSLLMGAGQVKTVFWISVTEVATVVVLLVAFVPSLGLTGIPLAGLAANILTGLFFFIPAACRNTNVSAVQFILESLSPLILAGVFGLASAVALQIRFSPSTWGSTVLASAISGGVTLTILIVVGTTARERQRCFVTLRRALGGE